MEAQAMKLQKLKKIGVDIESKIHTKCGGVINLTPKPLNALIGTCQTCGTTFAWQNLKEKK